MFQKSTESSSWFKTQRWSGGGGARALSEHISEHYQGTLLQGTKHPNAYIEPWMNCQPIQGYTLPFFICNILHVTTKGV